MRTRVKLLSLIVSTTAVLLAFGAFLVILGVFDEYLGWDIFSPEMEKILWGLFFSCVSLGGFGAAISVILGLHEVVKALRRMIEAANPAAAEPSVPIPRRSYVAFLAAILILLVVTVAGLNVLNRRVEAQRLHVFKLIVRDQMAELAPNLAGEVSGIEAPCEQCATPALKELHEALEGMSFCQSAVLFMADPQNGMALWRFPSTTYNRYGEQPPGFQRLFVASDLDRAVKLALSGDTAWIDQMNGDPAFNWHHVIRDGNGKIRGVIRILGNPDESYREYQAVAQAAEARGRKPV